MSSALRILVLVVLVFASMQRSNAATISVNAPDAYGRTFVDVVGTIDLQDVQTFQTKTANLQRVLVTLISYGGNAMLPSRLVK